MIFISLLSAISLRVYQIWNNYYFSGEQGRELLYVWQIIQSGRFPLIGLTTSHEWLNYGPIYYWILIPLVKIFGWSPYILYWLALGVSIIGILITYFVFKEIVSRKFAIIFSFFISLSPLWISVARLSKLHVFFFVLIPLVIYFLYKIWNKERKYILWLGIAFGALFSFHFSQIPLLLVIIFAFWIKRKDLGLTDYLKFAGGLIIPNISVLISDAQNGFPIIKNLFLWIPYRIAGFSGLNSKNNLSLETAKSTLSAFNNFFGQNLFWDSRVWILGSMIFMVLFTTFVIQNRKKFSKDFLVFYLISSTVAQCVSLFIHQSPPIHYFLPIFLNYGLFFSYFTCQRWNQKITRVMTILIFVLMFVAGFGGVASEHVKTTDYIPLKTQERVAASIVSDANGRPFGLVRVGPYDYFPDEYSQNYQFLILSQGGSLDKSAKLRYIIYDVVGTHDVVEAHDVGEVYVQKNERP